MIVKSANYLFGLQKLFNQHFELDDIQALCLKLGLDFDRLHGDGKSSRIGGLLLLMGRNGRLSELVNLAKRERPLVYWPPVPNGFQLPDFNTADKTAETQRQNSQNGDVVQGDKVSGDKVWGDKILGDKITAGDVQATNVAIGRGARVIIHQVHQALSAIDEMEKGIQVAERRLAVAIGQKMARYGRLAALPDGESGDNRRNPYKSLLDYKLEDAPYFFGREKAIGDVIEKIQQDKLTVLHADSGSGKTSLLQAGLAARLLADGHFPLYLRPYKTPPGTALKRAFLPDYGTRPELARFGDAQMSLKGFLERVTYYLGGRKLYIFLDQFEEFFTELDLQSQRNFVTQLQDCVESDLPAFWVLALRKEYFSDLRIFQSLNPFDNEYFLPTFNLEEAREVISEPARLKGVTYEEGLISRVLKDISDGNETLTPVHVQLVCSTLFVEREMQPNAQIISSRLYLKERGLGDRKAPGAKGILRSHLSRTLKQQMSGEERQLAWRVLYTLVTSQKRRAQRDRSAILNELQLAGDKSKVDEALFERVLQSLENSRLVKTDEDDQDELLYELAHEYLLDEFELDPQVQAIKLAQEILDQETFYYQHHGVLLAKDKFDIVNSQREHLQLDHLSRELLDKSEEQQTRELREAQERERKTRRWLRMALIFAIVAIAGTAIALFFFNQASFAQKEAEENAKNLQAELLAEQAITEASKNSQERDESLALLLAIESYSRTHNADVHQVMRTIIEKRQPDLFTLPGAAKWASWNSDETFLLTGSNIGEGLFYGNLMVWGKDHYKGPLLVLPDEAELAVWNAAGDRFMTFSWDGPVSVWDVASIQNGESEPRLTLAESAYWAKWTSNGSRILTRHSDGWRVWDGLATTSISPLYFFDPYYPDVDWSSDGAFLLLFLEDGTVTKLDSATLDSVWSLPGVATLADWNSTGTRVVVKRENDAYELWDTTIPPTMPLMTLPSLYWPVTDGWGMDGNRLVIQKWAEDGDAIFNLMLLDATNGKEIIKLEESFNWAVWEDDDAHIVTLRESGSLDLWDGTTGLLAASIFPPTEYDKRVWFWNDTERRRMDALGSMINGLNDTEFSLITLSDLPEEIVNSSLNISWMGWGNNLTRSNIVTWDGSTASVWTEDGTQAILQFEGVLGVGDNGGLPAIRAFDNDQFFLVASKTTVKIYPSNPMTWLDLGCQAAQQNLTWDAWRGAFPEEDFYHQTCPNLPVHPSVIDAVLLERFPNQIEPYLRQWESQNPAVVMSVRQAIPENIDNVVLTVIRLEELNQALELTNYYEQSFDGQTVSAVTLNNLCWRGTIFGRVDDVVELCNRAAELEPNNGLFLAGRGFSRALLGDYQGAAADFRFYANYEESSWDYPEGDNTGDLDYQLPISFYCYLCSDFTVIDKLDMGEYPFTPEDIGWLRTDWQDWIDNYFWEQANFYE